MGELDSEWHVRPATDAFQHAAHGRLVLIAPEADVGIADSAFGQDGGGFYGQQCGAGEGQLPQMDQVPVAHAAVDGGVLAHGSNDDAVGQLELTNAKRRKQLRFAHAVVLPLGMHRLPKLAKAYQASPARSSGQLHSSTAG